MNKNIRDSWLALLLLAATFQTVHAAPITAPTDISGHVLWLDGNDLNGDGIADSGITGTAFSSWVDKSSGLGVNTVVSPGGTTLPTQTFAAQNGLAATTFNGGSTAKLDNAAFTLATPYTIFTVVSSNSLAGTHVMSGMAQGATDEVLYKNGTSWRFYDGNAVDEQVVNSGAGGFHIFGVQVDPAANNVGIFDTTTTTALGWTASAQLDGLRVGNLSRGPAAQISENESWGGDIGEVVIYNRALSDGSINPSNNERNDVMYFLDQKWGLGLGITPTPAFVQPAPVVTLDASALALSNGQNVGAWGPATSNGTPTFLTGQTPNGGPAVKLDGIDDFGQLAAAAVPATGSGDFIAALVLKPESIGAYHNLIDDDGSVRPMIWIDTLNRYEPNFGGGTAPGIGSGPGGWDILIYDSKTNLLYLNSPTANGVGGGAVAYMSALDFDLFNRDGGQTFQGSIAELRIYNSTVDFAALYSELNNKWIVPEPSSWALGALAAMGLVMAGGKRRWAAGKRRAGR